MTRRTFCAAVPAAALAAPGQQQVAEVSFSSTKRYTDPFNDVELDAVVTGPDGTERRVPCYWAGGQTWRLRFGGFRPGQYKYRTAANDTGNSDLNGRTGVLEIPAYRGANPLLRHGPVRVASNRLHFEHADGTPFFWLGDTWWMGLTKRMPWPDGFQSLAADRVRKGFSVVQIIAGLYPDMPPFDPRGANEAGYPWEKDYARINPAYFDAADKRIEHLVASGLAPCIVGCWGYFLPLMGISKMKQHWRNIVARWGAFPVIWCLAGEGTMPYYLSKTPKEDAAAQKRGWTEIARYVRQIDPYRHAITVHPSSTARDSVEDQTVLDFDMLQTGHGDRASIPNTIKQVTGSLTRDPKMPTLVGEACYEGIMEASRQEVQRFIFWSTVLNGAAGFTYGANGIWQVNTAAQPFGPSPHGRTWGNTPWDVAAQLPGSRMVGLGKKFLTTLEWWRFEPHPEWVEPRWSAENYQASYAAGIPGKLRVIFTPPSWNPPKVKGIESGVRYTARFFDPATGGEKEIGEVKADANGDWQTPIQPTFADWVLVLKA